MKVFANVMIQNEAIILPHVWKYWQHYPVDRWIFYNDNSSDNTSEVIHDLVGDKAYVFNNDDPEFSECRNRATMFEYSRSAGADSVLAIDADELLSANLLDQWDTFLEQNESIDMQLYWYNVVGSVSMMRQDRMYRENYRTFFVPMTSAGRFDMGQHKYHTPRTPVVELPMGKRKDIGVLHLQSINRRYYALKQLWYKHYEYKTWQHPIHYINRRYDPVINNLNFEEIPTPAEIVGDIDFDAAVYDEIEQSKGYRQYILDNLVPELVTFGQEYLEDN